MKKWAFLAVLLLSGCSMFDPPAKPPMPAANSPDIARLERPDCGARIFVLMGINHKYPDSEERRIRRGDIYVNGAFVDTITNDPEMSVIDVVAGETKISWLPTAQSDLKSVQSRKKELTLKLDERQTAFVMLDYYEDEGSLLGTLRLLGAGGFHTEVSEAKNHDIFANKRVGFYRPNAGCARR